MSERPTFDLPWIMERLRHMVEHYESVPFAGDPGLMACLRITYWDRPNNTGITLVVGVEPARDDSEG